MNDPTSPHAVFDRHLRLQAEMSFGAELPIFHIAPGWTEARRVLDLGCGNGAFLQRLAGAFPDIEFIGVDLDGEMIEIARRDFAAPNIEYQIGTVDVVDDDVDVLMARFCLLYAPGLDEIQRWASGHVGTGILQIDNEDVLTSFPPSLARFEATLNATRIRVREGRPRTAATRTAPKWAEIGFGLSWSTAVAISSEPPFSRDLLHRWLVAMGEIANGSPLPDGLATDLERWHASGEYLQYAMRASWYRR